MPSPPYILSILTLTIFNSCSSVQEKDVEEETKQENNLIIGRVYSVAQQEKIVLIEKFTPSSLSPDGIYHSLGPSGQSASLRATGEKIRNFYAADLLNGNPQIGDTVILRFVQKSKNTSETDPPQDPSESNEPHESDESDESSEPPKKDSITEPKPAP